MARAPARSVKVEPTLKDRFWERLREGALLILFLLSIFVALALITYHPHLRWWGAGIALHNAGGRAGDIIAHVLTSGFGYFAYVVPVMLVASGYMWFRSDAASMWRVLLIRWMCLLVALVGAGGLVELLLGSDFPAIYGGIFGNRFINILLPYFNVAGTTLLCMAMAVVGFTMCTGFSWVEMLDAIGRGVLSLVDTLRIQYEKIRCALYERRRAIDEEADDIFPSTRLSRKSAEKVLPRVPPKIVTPLRMVTPELEQDDEDEYEYDHDENDDYDSDTTSVCVRTRKQNMQFCIVW